MLEHEFVYGVFRDPTVAANVVSRLHEFGLEPTQICVIGNQSEPFNRATAKIQDPTEAAFMRFGAVGALAGLWAGVSASPKIPYVPTFEILVPLMAAISGAVVFAYFAIPLCAFLTANRPRHWATVFEGHVEQGDVIVIVESHGNQRFKLMEVLDSSGAFEIVSKRAESFDAAKSIGFAPTFVPSKIEPEVPLSVVA